MTSGGAGRIRVDAPEDAASIPGLDHLHAGAADHLRSVAVASVSAARTGPIAAYLDEAGRPCQLDLEDAGPDGWWVRVATGVRGDPLPAVVLRGAVGLLPHALRSPLVRVDGAVTLARRATRRGDAATVDDELARLGEVTRAALERADAHAQAVQRLADRTPPGASPTVGSVDPADLVRAALDRVCAPTTAAGTVPGTAPGAVGAPASEVPGSPAPGAASDADAAASSGPSLLATIVLPSPRLVPAPALDRLLAHLTEAWGVRSLRIVAPGHAELRPVPVSGSGPPVVDVARWWDDREDPDLPLVLGRRWVGGDGSEVVEALADAAALVDGGVSVQLAARVDAHRWEGAVCPRPWVVQLPAVVAGWLQPLDAGVEVVTLGDRDA